MLKIETEFVYGILFIRFKGTLNKKTKYYFINEIIPIIKNIGIKYVVYNFSSLNSIDDEGYQSLIDGYNNIIDNKGNLLVVDNKFKLKYFKEIKDELSALKILKV